MGKKLYLVRHGETRFNVEHRVQGWCDSPLTARGVRELLPAVWRRLVGLGARPYGGDPGPGYEPRGARARACREPFAVGHGAQTTTSCARSTLLPKRSLPADGETV